MGGRSVSFSARGLVEAPPTYRSCTTYQRHSFRGSRFVLENVKLSVFSLGVGVLALPVTAATQEAFMIFVLGFQMFLSYPKSKNLIESRWGVISVISHWSLYSHPKGYGYPR